MSETWSNYAKILLESTKVIDLIVENLYSIILS